jgi:hypothetical protein
VHWNWANDQWRKVVLNAIGWIAKGDVPKDGIETTTPTVDEMLANHDEPVPANFDRDAMAKRIAEKSASPAKERETGAERIDPNLHECTRMNTESIVI